MAIGYMHIILFNMQHLSINYDKVLFNFFNKLICKILFYIYGNKNIKITLVIILF
jgi:hypothetical protein